MKIPRKTRRPRRFVPPPVLLPGSYDPARRYLVVELPIPAAILSPNARPHWRPLSKARKAHRFESGVVARQALAGERPAWARATERTTFYWPDGHQRRDEDNAAARMKSYFDGLTDAGVIADDSGLTHERVVMSVDAARPRVQIEVWGTDDNGGEAAGDSNGASFRTTGQ